MFTGKYLLKRGIQINITKSTRSAFNINNVKFFSDKKAEKTAQKLSFIDKIKQKFSIQPEEKIKYAELKNRDEESDNHRATKLENEEDLVDEGISKFENSTFSEQTNVSLDIEKISIDSIVVEKKKSDKEVLKGSALQILQSKFNINTNNFSPYVKQLYEDLIYDEILAPRIEALSQMGLTDFNIKILVQKSNTFLINEGNIDKLKTQKTLLKKLIPDFSESEINETLSCIPHIIDLSSTKIEANVNNAKNFFSGVDQKKLFFDYPLLITNFTSDLNKIEFYFKLYQEMTKDDLLKLAKKFPLILTATVKNKIFKNIFKFYV
jgi:hypothetical protein